MSLETALRMLFVVGASVRLTDPSGAPTEVRAHDSDAAAREARAFVRRKTWTARKMRLSDEGADEMVIPGVEARLSAVGEVSEVAYGIASARDAARPESGSTQKDAGG